MVVYHTCINILLDGISSLDSRYRAEAAVEVEQMRVGLGCITKYSVRLTRVIGRDDFA
jgi:hypothetical protein